MFKIDGDINSRGIAYFDPLAQKTLAALLKKLNEAELAEIPEPSHGLNFMTTNSDDITATTMTNKYTNILYAEIQREVAKVLPRKLRFAKRGIYTDYYHFIDEFCQRGGIVEASPSSISKQVSSIGVLFQLEPDGEVEIQTTFEKLGVAPFNTCGFKFPQSSLPNLNVSHI